MNRGRIECAGVDGCRAGWLYVALLDTGEFAHGVREDFTGVATALEGARLVLVDIPIGLPSAGENRRLCDTEARRAISPRGSTVFSPPARSTLEKSTYQEACAENQRVVGRKLSIQAWGIAPKIRQVDRYLRGVKPAVPIREMHPEVAFWALNHERPLAQRKKTAAGIAARLSLLRRYHAGVAACYEACLACYLRKNVARDDILDALVGAVTAANADCLERFPPNPTRDEAGLPMEIVYARPSGHSGAV